MNHKQKDFGIVSNTYKLISYSEHIASGCKCCVSTVRSLATVGSEGARYYLSKHKEGKERHTKKRAHGLGVEPRA